MSKDVKIGTNPLPQDIQEKLGEFLDWLVINYDIKNGDTALFWYLSNEINRVISYKETYIKELEARVNYLEDRYEGDKPR